MRCFKGSMVDYIVPTAIVGLVAGLAMYHMISTGSLQKFFASSLDMKVDQSTEKGFMAVDQTSFTSQQDGVGPLGGTTSVPVKACKDGKCDIDFGSYVLSGVPETMPSVEETAGTFGEKSTRDYASVLESLADSISADSPEQAARLDLLAAVTKNLADKQNYIYSNNNEKIEKKFLFVKYKSSSLGGNSPETALHTLGVNTGINQFDQFMTTMPDNPDARVASLPTYPGDFKDNVLEGNMSIEQYLLNKPTTDAALFFGLWNDVLGSSLSPEIKNAVNANLSGVADVASSINVRIEEGGSWYKKYEKLRGGVDKGKIPSEDILTTLMNGSSGQFTGW